MFSTIMVPVDLAHADTVAKSVEIAAGLGKTYNANIYLVGVTATPPGSVAHDPEEFEQKLKQYAAEQSSKHG